MLNSCSPGSLRHRDSSRRTGAGTFEVDTGLHRITGPVLILQGTADPITGQVLRYLPLIARAELKLMPGLNHVPISDDPAGLVSHINEFLQRVAD